MKKLHFKTNCPVFWGATADFFNLSFNKLWNFCSNKSTSKMVSKLLFCSQWPEHQWQFSAEELEVKNKIRFKQFAKIGYYQLQIYDKLNHTGQDFVIIMIIQQNLGKITFIVTNCIFMGQIWNQHFVKIKLQHLNTYLFLNILKISSKFQPWIIFHT